MCLTTALSLVAGRVAGTTALSSPVGSHMHGPVEEFTLRILQDHNHHDKVLAVRPFDAVSVKKCNFRFILNKIGGLDCP